jgi:hypothetical protein
MVETFSGEGEDDGVLVTEIPSDRICHRCNQEMEAISMCYRCGKPIDMCSCGTSAQRVEGWMCEYCGKAFRPDWLKRKNAHPTV